MWKLLYDVLLDAKNLKQFHISKHQYDSCTTEHLFVLMAMFEFCFYIILYLLSEH